MKIYLASSWRNPNQSKVLKQLRDAGHEVYDFKDPKESFGWHTIDPDWESWNSTKFIQGLGHPEANRGFARDFEAMHWADACVLLLPCGRSAHLEAGWCTAAGKLTIIFLSGQDEPELMYKMTPFIVDSIQDVLDLLVPAEV